MDTQTLTKAIGAALEAHAPILAKAVATAVGRSLEPMRAIHADAGRVGVTVPPASVPLANRAPASPPPRDDDTRPFRERLAALGTRLETLRKASGRPGTPAATRPHPVLLDNARRLILLAELRRVPLAEAAEALEKAEGSVILKETHGRGPMPVAAPRAGLRDRRPALREELVLAKASGNPYWAERVQRDLDHEEIVWAPGTRITLDGASPI